MGTRALALGGGGVTGVGWMLGLLHGLAECGIDLAAADQILGTSAGSVVGVQLTSGRSLAEYYADQLRPPDGEIAAKLGPFEMARLGALLLRPGDARGRRRRVGQAAIAAHPGSPEARLAVIANRLHTDDWPARDLRITTVEANTGALVVLDSSSGVDLVRAVAASCAVPLVWPPVPLADGRVLIDGGIRSSANADLVAGADTVVVLAPLPRSTSRHHSIAAQLKRTGATNTAIISPDAGSRRAIGRNVLDPGHRAAAARAGFAQAGREAAKLGATWSR